MTEDEFPKARLALRIIAGALVVLGLAWDLANAWWYLRPGPSGEWARLALVAGPLVGIPAGAFAFLAVHLAKIPPGRVRRAFQLGAGAAILIPILLLVIARLH